MPKKSKKSNSGGGSGISLNKVSFWLLCSIAVLCIASIILNCFDVTRMVVNYLQAVAMAVAVCVVGVLAWRFVSKKETVWKVLYFVILLTVLVGIVFPAVFHG